MFRRIMLCIVAIVALWPGAGIAQKQRPVTITSAGATASQKLVLSVGKSQVLTVSQAVGGIQVGDPDVADVKPLNDRSFYILGKKLGVTNVSVYGEGNRLLAVIDLTVRADVEAVKAALHEMLPDAR